MCFLCTLEQPYFCWRFGLVLDIWFQVIHDLYSTGPKGPKNLSTQREIKGKQNGPRVFLHQSLFSVRYFCNNLPKGQVKLGISTPSGFQCMVPFSVLPKVHFIPSRVSAEGIYIIYLYPPELPKYRQLTVLFG